jgi:DNA-binding transcriptional LysR family regulator
VELTDLKVFLAIMEEGSITRAAERLGYVQSNVTARIRKLETELGAQLFHRTPKGVTPTGKGTDFRKYATDILLLAEEAAAAIREPDYPSGPLAVGVVETVASSGPFMTALSDFQARYPEVTLSLVTGTSPRNYEKVLNRELDGAFVTGEFDLTRMHVDHEIRDEIVLLTAGDVNTPDSYPAVTNASWVVFPKGCPLRAAGEEWVRSEGSLPPNIIEIGTLETMLNCVRAGLGVAMLPESAVPRGDDRLRAHLVPESYRYATTRLIRKKEPYSGRAFTAFADCIRAAGL